MKRIYISLNPVGNWTRRRFAVGRERCLSIGSEFGCVLKFGVGFFDRKLVWFLGFGETTIYGSHEQRKELFNYVFI